MTSMWSRPAARRRVHFVSPVSSNPFVVALADLREAIGLAPVWLHAGWINVVWRFRRTTLGPFWHTLGLAAFVLVMGTLWSRILHQDPSHYFRYVTVSMIVWGLIGSFLTEGSMSLVSAEATALSMRFSFIAFSFAQVWRAVILFAHHLVFYVFVMVITWTPPGWPLILAIPAMILLLANGVWISLLTGLLCLRWRDLIPATLAAQQILMFVTPVFWPKDLLGERLAFAADYNPLYHLIVILRAPMLGEIAPVESWLWSAATLVVGALVTAWVYGSKRNRIPYWY